MNTGFIVFIKKNCSVYQAQPVAPIFLWVHLSRGKLFLSPSTEIANKVLAFQKYNHNLLVKVKTFHGNNFLLIMCKVLRSK